MADPEKTNNIKVLMYHRVIKKKPAKPKPWHYVTLENFKKQLQTIDSMGFTTITFYDYKLYLEDKLTLPAKPIIITFDDGYLDTYENALPALDELNMKAVIFVMGNRELKRATWDEANDGDYCPLMSDEQIRSAMELGFEIGTHSLNHNLLVNLSRSEVQHEIQESKKAIEAILDSPIYTFAYPYGSVNKDVKRALEDSDYSFACGVFTGSPKFGETRYDFRRLAINQHTSFFNFLMKLLVPFQYIEWMYHLTKTHEFNKPTIQQHTSPSINEEKKHSSSVMNKIYNSN